MATKRPPPTQAKLRTLVDSLKTLDTNDTRNWLALSDQIAKIYKAGLPSGIDTALIEECVLQKGPLTHDIVNMTKKTGTEYDEAIANGLRKLVGNLPPGLALDTWGCPSDRASNRGRMGDAGGMFYVQKGSDQTGIIEEKGAVQTNAPRESRGCNKYCESFGVDVGGSGNCITRID